MKVEVGALHALTEGGEVDLSVPSLAVREGLNNFGRNDSELFTKHVSRKHICITVSPCGTLDVAVEGPNPVVIRSGADKKKLSSKSKQVLSDGEVIEFIPGQLPFKYIAKAIPLLQTTDTPVTSLISLNNNNQDVDMVSNVYLEGALARKRKSQVDEDEALARFLQDEEDRASTDGFGAAGLSNSGQECSDTAALVHSTGLRAEVKRSKWESKVAGGGSTFHLLHTQAIPCWANNGSIQVQDVIHGGIQLAILSNYMVDVNWLLSACPLLNSVAQVVMIHGESGQSLENLQASKPKNWALYKPPLRLSYGTHHSKAMFLIYQNGVRVVVHTANLIYVDWNNKTQGLWMQDFPFKDTMEQMSSSDFENDLVEYLQALEWPGCKMILPHLGETRIDANFFRRFNYSSASVRLVASVPGYHIGHNITKWGHMKLRKVLHEQSFEEQFQDSSIVFQFSSLGWLDEKWVNELTASMSAGSTFGKKPLGLGKVKIVWPTVEDIRCSLEGYAAGNAVPSPEKNVKKVFLKRHWARWRAEHTGRSRAIPHMKSYVRHNGQSLAWFLLTSSNLSKAAWGALQKNTSQLMIRSYELGVCFLPSLVSRPSAQAFSCTDNSSSLWMQASEVQLNSLVQNVEGNKRNCQPHGKLVTSGYVDGGMENVTEMVVYLPVPYSLPPPPYEAKDVPWSWDCQYMEPDVYGEIWPRMV